MSEQLSRLLVFSEEELGNPAKIMGPHPGRRRRRCLSDKGIKNRFGPAEFAFRNQLSSFQISLRICIVTSTDDSLSYTNADIARLLCRFIFLYLNVDDCNNGSESTEYPNHHHAEGLAIFPQNPPATNAKLLFLDVLHLVENFIVGLRPIRCGMSHHRANQFQCWLGHLRSLASEIDLILFDNFQLFERGSVCFERRLASERMI